MFYAVLAQFVLKGVFPKELSRDFHRAFELRQVSDYKTFRPISKEKAQKTLNSTVHFVSARPMTRKERKIYEEG